MTVTTTAQLLLSWDKRRPRSQQTALGMSEVGGCRRRVGYRLAGQPPDNPAGSVQAVMGTAVHVVVEEELRIMRAAGVLSADDLIEFEVQFAGVIGHGDRYDAVEETVVDTKTTSQRWLDHIVLHGADRAHRWQTALYAAALIAQGKPVRRIVIDYLARDTGNDHQDVRDFDPAEVGDALDWLREVRETPLEYLNRDYAPDSAFCGHCPFIGDCWGGGVAERDVRSVLYVEDPDAVKWATQLWDARQAIKAAKELEDEAKGALDALRPTGEPGSVVVDVGYAKALRWSISERNNIDTDAVKAEYAKTGAKPPMKPPTTTVTLAFAPKAKPPKAAS